jgi:hypothetical protein
MSRGYVITVMDPDATAPSKPSEPDKRLKHRQEFLLADYRDAQHMQEAAEKHKDAMQQQCPENYAVTMAALKE